MNETLLRMPAVIQRTGYSRSSIYNLLKRNAFPPAVRLAGGGAVAWKESEVQAWIQAQPVAGSSADQPRQAAAEQVAA